MNAHKVSKFVRIILSASTPLEELFVSVAQATNWDAENAEVLNKLSTVVLAYLVSWKCHSLFLIVKRFLLPIMPL